MDRMELVMRLATQTLASALVISKLLEKQWGMVTV